MNHPDIHHARRHGDPTKCYAATEIVYSGVSDTPAAEMYAQMEALGAKFDPPPPSLKPFYGEMHGHTRLSDGFPDIDTYFTRLRDLAKLDFAALSDHDHGGLGKHELWAGESPKWELIKNTVKKYYEPGRFTTILAYERDSFPFYANMVVYYNSHDGEMIRGETDGMLRESELREILARDDIFAAPHDSYMFICGTDFHALPPDLMPTHLELYSRGDAAEYMGNPAFTAPEACDGGFWQDALRRGARTACIGGSDDHSGNNGLVVNHLPYPDRFPGLTGVWAEENTLPAIFDALKKRRCFTFMGGDPTLPFGGRILIDFRINGHYMGEEITRGDEPLTVFYEVKADDAVKCVTLVKNCRDYIKLKHARKSIIEYHQENETDCFYLRVELADGRFGWSSPIWVNR